MTQAVQLSNRQWEVVRLLLQGKSNKLIALSLGISERTVEFHLKNVYAKYQVSSRVELILKLGNTPGAAETGKLGASTVVQPRERADNRDTSVPGMDGAPSVREAISMIGKELHMKNLLNTKHVPVGVIAALLAGFTWVLLFRRFGHMTAESINPWVLPLAFMLALLGFCVALIAKAGDSSLRKLAFSTLAGAGLAPFAIIPTLLVVVLPLGKLIEGLGLVDRAAVPANIIEALVISAMLVIWLAAGIGIGTVLLFLSIRKPARTELQRQASAPGS